MTQFITSALHGFALIAMALTSVVILAFIATVGVRFACLMVP